MFTDCFNKLFDCSIRVFRSFCKLGGRAQQTFAQNHGLLFLKLCRHIRRKLSVGTKETKCMAYNSLVCPTLKHATVPYVLV